jgi:hypothetical protein
MMRRNDEAPPGVTSPARPILNAVVVMRGGSRLTFVNQLGWEVNADVRRRLRAGMRYVVQH